MGMNDEVYRDGFNLLCGREVGRGMTRTVFECNVDKSLVVKVESAEVRTHFQNMVEWLAWCRVAGTDVERWFAPVVEMSPDGRLVLMKRVDPLPSRHRPTHMPAFFTDFKPNNFGVLDGRVVCCDYGSHLLHEVGMTKRMRRVDWRDDS